MKSENKKLIKNHCENSINIALKDRSCANGGIETWIIPSNPKTSIQKKQEFFNKEKWGKGPDLEVVANFIYALQIYNASLYKAQI